MITDSILLEKARGAGRALEEAERQVVIARTEYHTTIRRLHLGGATLREIADVLGLSHQRVQQIVSAAGGSWWLVGRSRREPRDAVCSWCSRPPSEVGKLIAGQKVFICDACIARAKAVARGAGGGADGLTLAGSGSRQRCSFCNERANEKRPVVVGPANVCVACLHTCEEILAAT